MISKGPPSQRGHPVHVSVYTTDGRGFTVEDMPTEAAMHLAAELADLEGSPLLTFTAAGVTMLMQRQHIVSLELHD